MTATRQAPRILHGARALPGELRRFATFERVLGMLLVLTPALLIAVDAGPDGIRQSISAYHDVGVAPAFYVPLTVGAMLFLVNGIMRSAHVYNVALGVALLGVVIFDHDGGSEPLHVVSAVTFFGGNVLVMMFFSTNKSTLLKAIFVAVIAAALALLFLTDWFTLFWAEWVSLAIVATHFMLDSGKWSDDDHYRALEPGETPRLRPSH
jgi:hypothetical protein